ncbi:hypothetical protein CMK10_04415 [Candidatus Poribacteria bacterium]|nr:hypothetical protein [Candidatus Poribacteria bacterium]
MGNKYTISEGEKHFFDLTGYLLIQQALTSEEISKWNEAIGQYADKIRSRSKTRGIASKSEMLRSQSAQLELTGMFETTPHHELFRTRAKPYADLY